MTAGPWHGTKKCAVNGAKIAKYAQTVGAKCPFCGNTMGAALGSRKAPSLETQLDKLQKLRDDGVITDDELRERRAAVIDKDVSKPSTPRPRPMAAPRPKLTLVDQWRKNRPAFIVASLGVGLLVVASFFGSFDGAGSSRSGGGGSSGGDGPLPTSAAVISRIRSLTDCDELQREFDTAAENHDIQSDRGNLTLMRVSSAYMSVADDRMDTIGCYG
jgi:hypothetical protein